MTRYTSSLFLKMLTRVSYNNQKSAFQSIFAQWIVYAQFSCEKGVLVSVCFFYSALQFLSEALSLLEQKP